VSVAVWAGTESDARGAASLHVSAIAEGFLPTLGEPFLTRLYRRVVRDPGSFLLMSEGGFLAGTEDVSALYRTFLVRDGVVAGLAAAPRLARSWRKVLETMRYAKQEGGHEPLPPAELLAVAVDPAARGSGVGRALVTAFTEELRSRRTAGARVVVASDNTAAIGLYLACGFTRAASLEVHEGRSSTLLTWS
jgi:ribosomal protein S18 acetylase RimI-like enzyme